jgi:GMP synthase-like glutamine amidotransferase
MKFAVIDNNRSPMDPARGRGQGFAARLRAWTIGEDYEFVRYDDLGARLGDLMSCRGLILSGSAFDLADAHDRFDRKTYQKMIPEFRLIRDFPGPVLGICFGHQLMALGDEFAPGRDDFGGLRVRNMQFPRDRHTVLPVRMDAPLRFLEPRRIWAQFHHKQEVLLNDDLLKYYEITGQSNQCPVQIMQHRTREWFGVQFHPEIGVKTEAGDMDHDRDAEQDGQAVLEDFVRYCLG